MKATGWVGVRKGSGVPGGSAALLAGLLGGLLHCDSGAESCADLSGAWRLTVRCTGLVAPEPETWEQDVCRIVRHDADQELGSGQLDSEGIIVLEQPNALSAGAQCRGTATRDRVEVNCPTGGAQQTCGPDSCCVLRWER